MSLESHEIKLYEPNNWQQQVLKTEPRFKVIRAGKRSGKTVLSINQLLYKALTEPGEYWYVAPTYSMAKQIAWQILIEKYRNLPRGLQAYKNESELIIRVKSIDFKESTIKLKGGSEPDTLRGNGLSGMVIDECAFMEDFEYLWNNVLKDTLIDRVGWCWFISTPNGFNHFYDLYNIYEHWHFTTYDNNCLSDEAKAEVEKDKAVKTDEQFRQEILAEFIPQGSYAYFQGVDDILIDIELTPRSGHEYLIGCDLGRHHDSTVLVAISRMDNMVHGFLSMDQTDWNIQKPNIANFTRKYNNGQLVIDSTNNSSVAEDLELEGLNVEKFAFNPKNKVEILEKLRLFITQRNIRIPRIEKIVHELKKFEFRLLDNRLKLGTQTAHDDAVIALALAIKNLDAVPLKQDYGDWSKPLK